MNNKTLSYKEFINLLRSKDDIVIKYNDLIELSIKNNGHPKFPNSRKKGYEKHHIIPRSFSGSNEITNLVYLTPFQHILAHYYLSIMTSSAPMILAFRLMVDTDFNKITYKEQQDLEILEKWAELRSLCRQRIITDKGRKTISNKAKIRWANYKETGEKDKLCKKISETTRLAMNSVENKVKVRVNLGCKKYWNPETDEKRNWYPGMSEFKEPWIRGRGPMSEISKQKLKHTLNTDPFKWYHNDELKINKTFKQSEQIPDGWIIGKKHEYLSNYKQQKYQRKIDKLNELKSQLH